MMIKPTRRVRVTMTPIGDDGTNGKSKTVTVYDAELSQLWEKLIEAINSGGQQKKRSA